MNTFVQFPKSEALQHIEALVDRVVEAGAFAKSRFQTDIRTADKQFGDIVTEVDLGCEKIIIEGIRAIDPTHVIHSEEAGLMNGASAWTWIVDPLDGTHNYVSGIPLFGMIVSLCYNGEPVGAILHDAFQEETILGTIEGPVLHNGKPLGPLGNGKALKSATFGWTQGYAVQDDPVARQVRDTVESKVKRLMATWSPVIETIKVLTGKFGGIVSYDGEFTDLTAARALVPALGGKVVRFSRGGEDRRFIVGVPEYVDALLADIGPVMPD